MTKNRKEPISLVESLKRTKKAEEEYDECPICGGDYNDIDTTLTGNLVFVHNEDPLETCRRGGDGS